MERRLLAVSILAVIALGVPAAFFLLRDGSAEDGALATMSARETPVEMAVPERIGHPNGPLLTGEAFLLGDRRAPFSPAPATTTPRAGRTASCALANGS
jgi:hypothetical protein